MELRPAKHAKRCEKFDKDSWGRSSFNRSIPFASLSVFRGQCPPLDGPPAVYASFHAFSTLLRITDRCADEYSNFRILPNSVSSIALMDLRPFSMTIGWTGTRARSDSFKLFTLTRGPHWRATPKSPVRPQMQERFLFPVKIFRETLAIQSVDSPPWCD
jgi:hypothetical protein